MSSQLRTTTRGSAARAVAASTVFAAAATSLVLAARAGLPTATAADARLEDVFVPLLLGLAALVCGWLSLGSASCALAALPGAVGRLAHRVSVTITPAMLRRALGVALAGTLATGVTGGPALAVPEAPTPTVSAEFMPSAAVVDGTHLATQATPAPPPPPGGDRAQNLSPTVTSAATAPAPRADFLPTAPPKVAARTDLLVPQARPSVAGSVVVKRGDTLWSIAARDLGVDAGTVDVTRAWHAWYDANRETIGDNPDLILPGMRLVAPGAPSASSMGGGR